MNKHYFPIILFCSLGFIALLLFSFQEKKIDRPTDYKVIHADNGKKLSELVKGQYVYGYTCVGGVSVYTKKDESTVYVQAMQK